MKDAKNYPKRGESAAAIKLALARSYAMSQVVAAKQRSIVCAKDTTRNRVNKVLQVYMDPLQLTTKLRR